MVIKKKIKKIVANDFQGFFFKYSLNIVYKKYTTDSVLNFQV